MLLEVAACCTPGAGSPPATTVTGLPTTVCMVLLPAADALLMDPSWNGGACGADMGKEPAGHMQAQLHWDAAVAAAAPPDPATTVTAAATPVEEVDDATAALVEDEEDAAAFAVPLPPSPAMTLTAATAPAPPDEALLVPEEALLAPAVLFPPPAA